MQVRAVEADSGACSDHGGVYCNAGPSIAGNVMCKDGFESSTSYWSTKECSIGDICKPDQIALLSIQYQKSPIAIRKLLIQEIDNALSYEQSIIDSAQASANQTTSYINSVYNSGIGQLNSQYQNSQAYIQDSTQSSLGTARATMAQLNPYGGDSDTSSQGYLQRIQDRANLPTQILNNGYSANQTYLNNAQQIAQLQLQTQTASYVYPAQACISSLNTLRQQLISLPDFCTSTFGSNSISRENLNGNTCFCKDGYKWNTGFSSCIENLPEPSVQSETTRQPETQKIIATPKINTDNITTSKKWLTPSSLESQATTSATSTESASSVVKKSEKVDMWQAVKSLLQKLNPFYWFKK